MEIHKLLAVLLLLLPIPTCSCSSQETTRSLALDANGAVHPSSEKVINPKLLYEIKVHGFLLWASMGFLMPIGIISIRISNNDHSRRHFRRLFYLHATSQMCAVMVATIGAIMSIRNFDNSFNNYHQRLGVGLYVVIWFQALLGFLRPPRGHKARTPWFVAHWILGTSVAVLGIINIYTGLHAYTMKTATSVKLWTILFTIQLSCIAFFYLFQEKLSYIRNQTPSLGNKSPMNLTLHNNNSSGSSAAADHLRDTTTTSEKC